MLLFFFVCQIQFTAVTAVTAVTYCFSAVAVATSATTTATTTATTAATTAATTTVTTTATTATTVCCFAAFVLGPEYLHMRKIALAAYLEELLALKT